MSSEGNWFGYLCNQLGSDPNRLGFAGNHFSFSAAAETGAAGLTRF